VNDRMIQCPCYPICSGLGIETGQWCRYRRSDLPPPGIHRFDPREIWCPSGVQANVLMLGYLLAGQTRDAERLKPALEQVRRWARHLRAQRVGYHPVPQDSEPNTGE
jgi:hypothetical protein